MSDPASSCICFNNTNQYLGSDPESLEYEVTLRLFIVCLFESDPVSLKYEVTLRLFIGDFGVLLPLCSSLLPDALTGLIQPTMPRRSVALGGQARKHYPRLMSAACASAGRELLTELRRQPSSRRLAEYEMFCTKNGLEVNDENLCYWAAQLEEDKIAVRSRRLYLSQVRKQLRAVVSGTRISARLIRHLTNESTTAPRRHARDLDGAEIELLLGGLRAINKRVALVAFAMWLTGLRFVDLTYCHPSQFVSTARAFFVDVKKSKAIRSDWLRRELTVPACCQPPIALLGAYIQELVKLPPGEPVAPADSTSVFNGYLKALWTAEAHSAIRLQVFGSSSPRTGRAPTSYTLRRAAFARFIEYCRAGDGLVDWERAAQMSLHFRSSTLQAFYYKGPPHDLE